MSSRIKVSTNQSPLFKIDDTDNVTYFVNGRPQTLEQLREQNEFEDVDATTYETDLDLMGFAPEVQAEHDISTIEKEDDRTVQLSISDLEKIRRILTAIPQFREMALEQNTDVNSIEFLADAVQRVDFMSLPHFDTDMSIFDLLVKNNPEYRDFVFETLLDIANKVGATNKFPSKRYLARIFKDFTEDELEAAYQLLKRFLSMLNAWGGIQIHYFEQTIRDWLYIVYERGGNMGIEEIYLYLQTRYPCKPDYEVHYIANMIANSISFNTNIDEFVDEFLRYMQYFEPEENLFLTKQEVYRLWTSDYLKDRVKRAANRWRSRVNASRIIDPEDELEAFFGVDRRLSQRVMEGELPEEVYTRDFINETIIKLKLYFPEGHRTLIEARIDRLVRVNGTVAVYDWKTRRKELAEMDDFEKLQIILQCIAVQSLVGKSKEGSGYTPMTNKDYKFFLQSTALEWVSTDHLPQFLHIPEQAQCLYDYVLLNIEPGEVNRILGSFSNIVNFLICNKKKMAEIRRHLKDLDNYIPAPKIAAPEPLEIPKRVLQTVES